MQLGKAATFIFLLLTSQAHSSATEITYDWPVGLQAFYKFDGFNQNSAILGEKLFFSTALSRHNNISCASCHKISSSTADLSKFSTGTNGDLGKRNSPVIFNTFIGGALMYDGRAPNILLQVHMPLEAKDEMDIDIGATLERLKKDIDFNALVECLSIKRIDYLSIKQALSSYVTSLVSGESRFDRYFYLANEKLLSEAEIRGFELFRSKANCTSCHKIDTTFAAFSDNGFHNLGIGYADGVFQDNGRYIVTGYYPDKGSFKTPTLRNITKTAPYMHNGSLETLFDVIKFYNDGGVINPYLDKKIKPLNLTESEMKDIVSFLGTLESPVYFYNESSNKCVN